MRSVGSVFGYVIQRGQKGLDLLFESTRDAVQPPAEPGESVPLELEAVDVAKHVPEGEVLVQVRGEFFADDPGLTPGTATVMRNSSSLCHASPR